VHAADAAQFATRLDNRTPWQRSDLIAFSEPVTVSHP